MNFPFFGNSRNVITVTQNRKTKNLQMKLICTVVNEAHYPGIGKSRTHHLFGDQNSAITGPNDQCVRLSIRTVRTSAAEDSPE
ncbi:hypothetical protein D3C73_981390 [compost metagenome]